MPSGRPEKEIGGLRPTPYNLLYKGLESAGQNSCFLHYQKCKRQIVNICKRFHLSMIFCRSTASDLCRSSSVRSQEKCHYKLHSLFLMASPPPDKMVALLRLGNSICSRWRPKLAVFLSLAEAPYI